MQSIASGQTPVGLALNEVFGSKGQVRLLRILALETDGFVASPEVASRAGLTRSGARKALRRLVTAGLVDRTGSGRHTRYVLKRDNPLTEEIVRLFEVERQAVEPGWAREHSRRESRETPRANGNGNGVGHGNGNGASPGNGATHGDGNGAGHGMISGNGSGNGAVSEAAQDLTALIDPESPVFHEALASLLAEELSLIKRAREKVLEKLEHRRGASGQDLWEWRKVLDTYPVPRLLHFLESQSPRAQRLRRSSPFPEVVSDQEKERMAELAERMH